MKVLSVVGARPQFVKLAPIATAMSKDEIQHVIVHTGQHYDPVMSDVFFTSLGIPTPDVHFGIGSGTHASQTGAMLMALEAVMEQERPDWTLVYGDTNSTLAAALAAVKIHLRVAHLEAGLRSFNRRMPEEHNRVLTDHAADILLAPTDVAMQHLINEGLGARAIKVGDVMTDVCFQTRDAVVGMPAKLPEEVGADEPYIVATIHRADNTDNRERLLAIVCALQSLSAPVVLLAHPRLVARAAAFGLELNGGAVHAVAPLDYLQMVRLVLGAAGVVTDSGGLQKEAYLLGVPCVTLRSETEWVETIEDGWNILDPDLVHVHGRALRPKPAAPVAQPFGDGLAAARVVATLRDRTG